MDSLSVLRVILCFSFISFLQSSTACLSRASWVLSRYDSLTYLLAAILQICSLVYAVATLLQMLPSFQVVDIVYSLGFCFQLH